VSLRGGFSRRSNLLERIDKRKKNRQDCATFNIGGPVPAIKLLRELRRIQLNPRQLRKIAVGTALFLIGRVPEVQNETTKPELEPILMKLKKWMKDPAYPIPVDELVRKATEAYVLHGLPDVDSDIWRICAILFWTMQSFRDDTDRRAIELAVERVISFSLGQEAPRAAWEIRQMIEDSQTDTDSS